MGGASVHNRLRLRLPEETALQLPVPSLVMYVQLLGPSPVRAFVQLIMHLLRI